MSRILIADDDDNLRYSFQRMLDGRGYTFIEAADGNEAVEKARLESPDVVVMDVRMPGMSGLDAFEQIKRFAPELPVIVMTAYGTTETAIEAMKRGAFDYTLKPFDVEEMGALIARALKRGRGRAREEDIGLLHDGSAASGHRLVGSSRAMQRVYKAVGLVAESDVHVLILGETGTGKELVARAIHDHSKRGSGPFLAINCAAIPEPLIEGELFGHEKGAFTGADHAKKGLLSAASGGTVFLDEISEIPLPAQAKLLRFLQDGEVIRLGGEIPIKPDVRVIAASNRSLRREVAQGSFREDLFYRFNAMAITLPPLRDRLEDLEALVAHFVSRFNEEHHKSFSQISGKAIAMLRERPWRGNVRELENLTRKAVIVGQGPVLIAEHLFPAAFAGAEPEVAAPAPSEPAPGLDGLLSHLVDLLLADDNLPLLPTLERMLIAQALERTAGNQVQAARLLGISRNTLRSRMDRHGVRAPAGARTSIPPPSSSPESEPPDSE
jgi:DNA-binding NtrC family response regulator